MGIFGWIAVGLAAGLLANMLLPGKRSRGLIFTGLTGITAVLGGDWTASLFREHGLGSFPGWTAALAEVAVLLLACHLLTRSPRRFGGLTRRWETPSRGEIPEGSP
ncbi:MAG: GlsB/YeaQ/YmgE family stress response membrane protein [Actinomycetota bacterium]|nr:GlsB/YeaQ/YmgE family stress response membrane protein [Actinomycetota bacterium]